MRLIASCDMMCGEYLGRFAELGCFISLIVMIGGSSVSLFNRGDLRVGGSGGLRGLMMAGTAPGMLRLVRRKCVRGLACNTRGLVGLVEVVTGGESPSELGNGSPSKLCIGSPSERCNGSTL